MDHHSYPRYHGTVYMQYAHVQLCWFKFPYQSPHPRINGIEWSAGGYRPKLSSEHWLRESEECGPNLLSPWTGPLIASEQSASCSWSFFFHLFLQKCLSPSNKTFDDHYSVVVFNLHLFERHVISLCWLTGVRFVERGSLSSSYFSSSLFGLWNRMSWSITTSLITS